MLVALDERELAAAGHMAEDVFVRQMKRRRAALNLSQAELAGRIADLGGSLYQQTIAKIEAGQRAVRLQEADLIAKALRSTVSEMLALSIGDPEASPEEMDVDELIEQVRATRRRRDEATSRAHAAREEAHSAREALQVAEQRAAAAEARVHSAVSYLEVVDRELNALTRASLNRQSELNARYGPRWREKMSDHEPITLEMVQEQNRQHLEQMKKLADSTNMNSRDREVLMKSIERLEERVKEAEEGGDD